MGRATRKRILLLWLLEKIWGQQDLWKVEVTHQEMEHSKELARWHEHMVSEPAEYVLDTFVRMKYSTYPDMTE